MHLLAGEPRPGVVKLLVSACPFPCKNLPSTSADHELYILCGSRSRAALPSKSANRKSSRRNNSARTARPSNPPLRNQSCRPRGSPDASTPAASVPAVPARVRCPQASTASSDANGVASDGSDPGDDMPPKSPSGSRPQAAREAGARADPHTPGAPRSARRRGIVRR